MKIANVMTAPRVSVQPDKPARDSSPVSPASHRKRAGGRRRGAAAGLVTETDLFPHRRGVPFSTVTASALFDEWACPKILPALYERFHGRPAEDVMTPEPRCVDADADLSDAIRLMMDADYKHVPVLRHAFLVGIVTRHDLLRAFC